MPPDRPGPADPEALREEAGLWFARMRGPDAAQHRAAFDRWRDADPAHQAAYDRMTRRWNQTALIGHTRAAKARTGLVRQPRWRAGVIAAAAAALIAIVAVPVAMRWHMPGNERAATGTLAHSELVSPVGTVRHIELPDGSRVVLDTDTRLTLAFSAGERRLELRRGRARFAVAKDAARPFIVAAAGSEIVATGTLFEISLIAAAPQVRLLEGAVEVRPASRGETGTSARRLLPGQQLLIAPAAVPQPLVEAETRWASGMLSFTDAPLSEVLAALNRYSTRKILLADPALGELRVTASFRVEDPETLAA
ncbi:MAG TPA: FecR domain-containing protein, partial [Sphingomonas sp.]|nr:FecR domain-containing protein [Sphingomonas sp.]